MMESVDRVFESTVDAPRLSRRFIEDTLRDWHADELAPIAELLTSELVTNVVRYAATPIDVAVMWQDPTLRVEVADGSAVVPAIADTVAGEGGRGLLIVSQLARDWGVSGHDHGKAVWFTIDRAHQPT